MTLLLPVDHLVVLVPDLDAARAAFIDAGFNATPVTRHSEAMGTANSCIMLKGTYIELMSVVAETPANEGWRALLAAGAGLRGFALASEDIEETAGLLAAKQIDAEPVRHFSRETAKGELRFSVIRLPRASTPGLQCIFCQHHTPKLLWTRDAMRHPNGATRLEGASASGIWSLAMLGRCSATFATPIEEAEEGTIAIAMREAIPVAQLAAIEATCGIRLEPRAAS